MSTLKPRCSLRPFDGTPRALAAAARRVPLWAGCVLALLSMGPSERRAQADDNASRFHAARKPGTAGTSSASAFLSVETVWDLEVSPDGAWLHAASAYGNVRTLDAASLAIVKEVKTGSEPVQALAVSADGTKLAYGDSNVVVLDTRTGAEHARLPKMQGVTRLRFSPKGALLAVAAAPGDDHRKMVLELWDVDAKKRVHTLATTRVMTWMPTDMAFSPDGQTLAVGVSNKKHGLELFDVESGERTARIAHGHDVSTVAFSPDGAWLASAGVDRRVTLWRVKTRKKVWSTAWHDGEQAYVHSVAFSPDGKELAACGRGSGEPVRVYSVADGTLAASLGKVNPVGNAVRWAPDGKRIYVAFTTYGNLAKVPVVQAFPR